MISLEAEAVPKMGKVTLTKDCCSKMEVKPMEEAFGTCGSCNELSICNSGLSNLIMTSPSGEPTNQTVKRQLGTFDIFKIGMGPSSSHTNGPMVAGFRFYQELCKKGVLNDVARVQTDLFGSLALTGIGHGTDQAVCVGLAGEEPSTVDPDKAETLFHKAKVYGILVLGGEKSVSFAYDKDMIFHMDKEMPQHPNAMHITAFNSDENIIHFNEYLSLGGGFVQTVAEFEEEKSPHVNSEPHYESGSCCGSSTAASSQRSGSFSLNQTDEKDTSTDVGQHEAEKAEPVVPYPFSSAVDLILLCRKDNMTIAEIMMENEKVLSGGDRDFVNAKLDAIWKAMSDCVERGLIKEGCMPVSGIERCSPKIYKKLMAGYQRSLIDHFAIMDWVCLFARSVNEENACGGRVVTAPTNGASGTLPAVLSYFDRFSYKSSPEGVRTFLLTAAAFGILIKTNASISGAEAGCQAEVGSACAMAAAGLTAALGGTIEQIENAAEIALEHNLGMTCDPIGGLVQVPCIERNCLAAVKAITAHRLACQSDGIHEVSFDSCVETMYRTGLDMQAKYRETSTGGLALYARKPLHIIRGARMRRTTLNAMEIEMIDTA